MNLLNVNIEFLDRLFPFHMILNRHNKIVELGPSLKKMLKEDILDKNFSDYFSIIKPDAPVLDLNLNHFKNDLIVVRVPRINVDLRGQAFFLSGDEFKFLALNLIVQEPEELSQLSLNFGDFAVQDPIFDFLMLLQTQKRAIEQAALSNEKLIKANKAANQAAETKSQFLANMSHELRTPMNGFLGMASILIETPLSAEQKDYVETLIKSGESMLALVNDILDFSKIEAGFVKFENENINIQSLLQDIYNTVYSIVIKKDLKFLVQISPDVPLHIMGDQARLKQVLLNLVGNAIKFTIKGSVILEVKLLENKADKVELQFSIKDTGIGMDAYTLSRIFSPFVQGDSSMTKKFEGTGLGLSITKKLVEGMGGKICVSSVEGSGSEFTIYNYFDVSQNKY